MDEFGVAEVTYLQRGPLGNGAVDGYPLARVNHHRITDANIFPFDFIFIV